MTQTWSIFQAGEVSERVVHDLLGETSCLSREDRLEVDRRLAPKLPILTVEQVRSRVRQLGAELDAASVVARMSAAVASRRVSVRSAPAGMAYLTVLGPLPEVVCAYASLTKHPQYSTGALRDLVLLRDDQTGATRGATRPP